MNLSETKFIVRYAETDQMGIVHHSNYAVWFEAGRTDFFKKVGVPNTSIESRGVFLPLYEMNCQFKNPARYENEILVVTRLKSVSCIRLRFLYEVLNAENNILLATGETMHAWTTKELQPINSEKIIPDIYLKLSEIINKKI